MASVIVGAGIAGLFSAYLIKKNNPKQPVFLIDKNSSVGGLLRSFKYEKYGFFDYGIHTIYQTGNSVIDDFLHNVWTSEDWIYHTEHKRDFGGSFFNGKLQVNSSYIDLRNYACEQYEEMVEDFFANKKNISFENSKDYFESKFGCKINQHVFEKIAEKVFGFKCEQLDPFVAKILPLERVVMFDEPTMDGLMSSKHIRDRLAYTDQLKLPRELLPNKKAIYPKVYGLQRLVDTYGDLLKKMGVQILLDSQVDRIEAKDQKIQTIYVNTAEGPIKIENIQNVYNTTGLFGAAKILGHTVNFKNFDKPLQTVIVNFVLKKKPEVKDLFYIYCFEPNFITHRISCPTSFCPPSTQQGHYKISCEVILKNSDLSKEAVLNKVIQEMEQMSIFRQADIEFNAVEMIEGGYPVLTTRMSQGLEQLNQELASLAHKNFTHLGLMSRKNLFFQTDILQAIFEDLENIKEA